MSLSILELIIISKQALLQANRITSSAHHFSSLSSKQYTSLLSSSARQSFAEGTSAEAGRHVLQLIGRQLTVENQELVKGELARGEEKRLRVIAGLSDALSELDREIPMSLVDRMHLISGAGMTLRSLVDEDGLQLDELDRIQDEIEELLHQLSDIPNQLFNLPPPLQLPSSQQLPCIADASHHFNLQAPILQTMDLELESVQNHLDQLSTAAKADDFDEEEFQVLTRDTEELEDILGELQGHRKAVEDINNIIQSIRPTPHPSLSPDALQSTQAQALLSHHSHLHSDIRSLLSSFHQILSSLVKVTATYVEFSQSFSALELELLRREEEGKKRQKVVEGWTKVMRDWEESDEREEREFGVRHEGGLPVELLEIGLGKGRGKRWKIIEEIENDGNGHEGGSEQNDYGLFG